MLVAVSLSLTNVNYNYNALYIIPIYVYELTLNRSIAIDGPELRSISMMTAPSDSLFLPESPFGSFQTSKSAPTPMRGIMDPNDDFQKFKYAGVAKQQDSLNELVDTLPPYPRKQPFATSAPKIILTPELRAQIIQNPTKATFVPSALSGLEIRLNGWGPSGLVLVRNLPKVYPCKAKLIRNNAFPMESLSQMTMQIQIYNKAIGFQVIYQEKPLKAIVQTPNSGQFTIDFWASSVQSDFCLALNALRSVGIQTQCEMNALLKALRENGENIGNMPLPSTKPFDRQSLERLESYLDTSVQAMEAKRAKTDTETPFEFKRNVLEEIHQGLLSESLDQRKSAMSLLMHGTDLKSTLGSFACRVTAVVLAGSSLDQAELEDQKAMDIHKTLIRILQDAEFAGDSDRFQDYSEMDTDSTNRFNSKPFGSRKRPRYYEDFMCDLHNMAMTILVQALEVAVCFEQHKDLIQRFVTNYHLTNNGSMNAVLENCIFQVSDPLVSHSLSKGYLACKALRILAESNSDLRKQVGLDNRTKSSILGALEVGESSHWLLHRESKDLHDLIYGQI